MGYYKIETTPDAFKSKYSEVPSSTIENIDHVIPDGETYEFIRFYGSSSASPETLVCVTFDPGGGSEVILFATHGDGELKNNKSEVTGDGTKVIRISLRNDQTESDWLGCGWEAVIK